MSISEKEKAWFLGILTCISENYVSSLPADVPSNKEQRGSEIAISADCHSNP